MGKQYCIKCDKMLDETQFYKSHNVEKYPPIGRLSVCKKCLTMHVDNWDPQTFLPILEELDIPYIKSKWNDLLTANANNKDLNGTTILGKYIATMKLKQYKDSRYADSDRLNQQDTIVKINAMKAQGLDNEEIEQRIAKDDRPPKPERLVQKQQPAETPSFEDPSNQEDEFSDKLTEEDKLRMQIKWGRNYRPEEWVRMEQLYQDMMKSYDIQTAGHKDTLIMICKASLKTNQLLDAGDIDGAQKMAKMYDSLMKSGKFTAAQNKDTQGDYVDSVGELVAMCEKEGFIPRYYTDGPQDKVDRTLQDLQQYTHTLVTEEMNLGNMIESSLKEIIKDKEREAKIDVEDGDEEDNLFDYNKPEELTEDDYVEYEDMIDDGKDDDQKLMDLMLGEGK